MPNEIRPGPKLEDLDPENFKPEHRELIEVQYWCCLCRNSLALFYRIRRSENLIEEEAFCVHCDQRMRRREYAIH